MVLCLSAQNTQVTSSDNRHHQLGSIPPQVLTASLFGFTSVVVLINFLSFWFIFTYVTCKYYWQSQYGAFKTYF